MGRLAPPAPPAFTLSTRPPFVIHAELLVSFAIAPPIALLAAVHTSTTEATANSAQ